MPAISVIVPVYKVEKYIHRCVDSILAQTFTDFELILVDDGSPDNCGAICDEYAAKDSRVVVIHQENGGLSAARNAGIDWAFANSDSQWLSFIDSDDWVHPEYLRCLLNAAVEHNAPVSICGYAKTDGEEPEIIPEDLKPVIWNTEDFYVEHNVNATVAWGKLYCKECFRSIRYPVGRIHEDEFITYRILFQFANVAVIATPLYMYFQNTQSITGSKWNINRLMALVAYEEQIHYFKAHKYIKAYNFKLKSYFLFACVQIENIMASEISHKKKYRQHIVRSMRMLWYLNKRLPSYPKEQEEWILAKIFPGLLKPYFVGKSILLKLWKGKR